MRFFDRPGRPFPRVLLDTLEITQTKILFAQRDGSMDEQHETLPTVYARLRPFMAHHLTTRDIPVCINALKDYAEVKRQPSDVRGRLPFLIPAFVASTSVKPRLVRDSLDNQLAVYSDENVSILAIDRATFVRLDGGMWGRDGARALRFLSQAASSEETHRCQSPVQRVELRGSDVTTREIAAVCSLLPHSRSVHTFWFHVAPKRPLAAIEWAWLGYALFHPDSHRSAWQDLYINVSILTAAEVGILQSMAVGNNMISASDGRTTSLQHGYQTALVREGARVRMTNSPDGQVAFIVEGTDTQVTPCAQSSGELVQVVVLGMGFAWVASSDLVEVWSRPATRSRLRSLQIYFDYFGGGHEHLAPLVETIGSNLTRLDGGDRRLVADALFELLRFTPKLKSLTVRHDGSLWSTPEYAHDRLPRLEELCVDIGDELAWCVHPFAIETSLRDLKALRVEYATNVSSLGRPPRTPILEAHPRLEYFDWYGATNVRRMPWAIENNYLDRRTNVQFALAAHPWGALFCPVAPLRMRPKLGFLSVRRLKQDGFSSMGRLDSHLVAHIFSYASSETPRDIWIC